MKLEERKDIFRERALRLADAYYDKIITEDELGEKVQDLFKEVKLEMTGIAKIEFDSEGMMVIRYRFGEQK